MKRPSVNIPGARASRFRRRRFALIEGLIRPMLTRPGRLRVLDVGGRRDYWDLLDPEIAQRLSITILNNQPIELESHIRPDDPIKIDYALGDACDMPQYADASFDLVHSNSVTRARLGWRRKIGYRSRMPTYHASPALADHTELVDQTLMRELFPDAELVKERVALLVKSLIVTRPDPKL